MLSSVRLSVVRRPVRQLNELVAGGTERKRVELTSLLQASQSAQGAGIAS